MRLGHVNVALNEDRCWNSTRLACSKARQPPLFITPFFRRFYSLFLSFYNAVSSFLSLFFSVPLQMSLRLMSVPFLNPQFSLTALCKTTFLFIIRTNTSGFSNPFFYNPTTSNTDKPVRFGGVFLS